MNTLRTSSARAVASSLEILEARIAPAFAASISLGALDGINGFKLSGGADFDAIGNSVSDAGDVNGDGIADVFIGAVSRDEGYVVFGKAGGLGASVALAELDGTDGFKINGEDITVDLTGNSVSTAGDVNGDGFADLIIADYFDNSQRGAAFVVFGKAGGFGANVELAGLDGSNGFKIEGAASGDLAGCSVSAAGDVNGDGFADLIVGAQNAAEGGTRRGAAYVVFGKAGGFAASVALAGLASSDGFKLPGVADDDRAGASVSGAGDVNGDGFADLIIGASSANEGGSNRGAAYVVFGAVSGFGTSVALSGLDGETGFKLSGVVDEDQAGRSVSAAGDVNGDGFDDLIIGADRANEGGTDRGAAYVVFGKASGFTASVALSGLDGSNGFKLRGVADTDFFGGSVSAAGDVNSDGFADVIIGANGANEGGANRGASYVVFGRAGSFSAVELVSNLDGSDGFKLSGFADDDAAGRSVSAAGDVNGDGFADLLVGASGADEGGNDRGAAYVIFGQPDVAVKFSNGGKTATFPDTDGDLVTVKLTKGALSQRDFTFSDGVWQKLDLSGNPLLFGGTNVTVTVKLGGGNGTVNLGALDASGLDLGMVKLPGDLGQIDAGDANFKTPAIKSLTVGSLGADGSTQPFKTRNPFTSDLVGALPKLKVSGDMKGVVNLTGGQGANLGSVSIGGNLDGGGDADLAGLLRAGGNIGAVTVKGSVIGGADFAGIIAGGKLGKVSIGGELTSTSASRPVIISALGDFAATTAAKAVAIAGVSVKGSVTRALILAGYTASLGAANPDAGIGAITVGGAWTASSVAAGVTDATGDGFGRNDTLIAGDVTPTLFATIASITIKGPAIGSVAPTSDHFGITAQLVKKLKIGATTQPLTNAANDVLLDVANNDFRAVDFA